MLVQNRTRLFLAQTQERRQNRVNKREQRERQHRRCMNRVCAVTGMVSVTGSSLSTLTKKNILRWVWMRMDLGLAYSQMETRGGYLQRFIASRDRR